MTCYKNKQDETLKTSKNLSAIQTTDMEENLLQKIKEYVKKTKSINLITSMLTNF